MFLTLTSYQIYFISHRKILTGKNSLHIIPLVVYEIIQRLIILSFQTSYDIREINRCKETDPPTIKGTRSLHQISTNDGALMYRNLACFCDGCLTNGQCSNTEFVAPWVFLPNQNPISPAVTKDLLFKNFCNAVTSATDFDAIKSICKSFHHDMIKFPCPTYPNKLKDFTPDLVAAALNPDKNMTPVCVIGDGNCLPRCASILAYGHEENHKEMRSRIIIELVTNFDKYIDPKNIPEESLKTYAMVSGEVDAIPGTPPAHILQREIVAITKPNTYMGIWQIHAISSILGAPIKSTYPERGPEWIREQLNRHIQPIYYQEEPVPSSDPVGILWTSIIDTKEEGPAGWSPNHFVVCLPAEDGADICILF